MKVYELIAELSEMPAGADVEIRTIMTLQDFAKCPIIDDFEGENAYLISGDICEVDRYDDKKVTLLK